MKELIGRQCTVLFIDDEELLLEAVAESLRQHFGEVLSVTSVDAAIKIIEVRQIDCIVTDFQMPGKTGIDLIDWLRNRQSYIPVILVTAYGGTDEVLQGLQKGGFDYLDKPFRFEVLINRIRNALILPRLENLILEFAKVEFPKLNVEGMKCRTFEERMKMLVAIESLVKTRLLAKGKLPT